MPDEIHAFMRLFPQPTRMRPSVEYVPVHQPAGRQART